MFSTAIGFGAIAVLFDPKGITLEEYDGLPVDIALDLTNPARLKIDLKKVIPIMPAYVKDLNLVQEVVDGKRTVPSTAIGAGLAAILSAAEVTSVILGKDVPKAPKYTFVDLVDQQLVVDTIK
jgi:hypothetical protein